MVVRTLLSGSCEEISCQFMDTELRSFAGFRMMDMLGQVVGEFSER